MKRSTIFENIFDSKRCHKLSFTQKAVAVLAWTVVGTIIMVAMIMILDRAIEISLSENHIYTGMNDVQFTATVAASALMSLVATVTAAGYVASK